MSSPRIGSLCSGYGGLDLAVMDVLPGAEVAWHSQYDPDDKHQWAARILEHRWPGIPNHGDITRADWFDAAPVDVITAGFPCQPVSHAGRRKGAADARWIWPAVAQCVRLVRPRIVVLENVAALVVRGLPDVAADLARIGYVGSWLCLRASDVGAPHQRNRVFIIAEPAADTEDHGHQRRRQPRRRRPGPEDSGVAAADTACQPEGERADQAHAIADRGNARAVAGGRGVLAAADPARVGRGQGRPEPAGQLRGSDAALGGGTDWGTYGPAVARWEAVTRRSAPSPVDDRRRLAPRFVEWMMGLPNGWVTDVPGIPRSAQLKALGNGVVPQQGAAAIRILAERLGAVRRP